MRRAENQAPIYAVEQEYTIMTPPHEVSCDTNSGSSGGWPHAHLPDPTKPILMTPAIEKGETNAMLGRNCR